MSEKIISAETLKFVRRSFESVWALELILMMRRENTRCWSVSELTQQLRASELLVGGILPDLVRKGWCWRPRQACSSIVPPQSNEQLVDKVAVVYAENRIRLINEIFKVPDRNAQTFADAFRIKKG
jgi:hypothetical protein